MKITDKILKVVARRTGILYKDLKFLYNLKALNEERIIKIWNGFKDE